MLKQSEILKLDDYWHCNTKPIRLKCPKCLSEIKNSRQVKVSKNIKSLSRHIATEHQGEFWTDECKLILKKLAVALDSGLIVQ